MDDKSPWSLASNYRRTSKALVIPGRKKLTLPKGTDGFEELKVAEFTESSLALDSDELYAARQALICESSFVMELGKVPESAISCLKGPRVDPMKAGAREIIVGHRLRHNGMTLYHLARVLVLQHGLGFGSAMIVRFAECFAKSRVDAAIWIIDHLKDLPDDFKTERERGAPNWATAALLLGGMHADPSLPAQWKRQLKTLAGLYRISLDVRVDPDSNIPQIVGELKQKPPDMLLVWANWIMSPDTYISPYRHARRDGLAESLGSEQAAFEFAEDAQELIMRLDELHSKTSQDRPLPNSWAEADEEIRNLTCDSLIFTSRCLKQLANCSYPNPSRMFQFVEALRALSKTVFSDGSTELSARLSDIAIREHKIEIAMHDSSLKFPSIFQEDGTTFKDNSGNDLTAQPHVKVDDNKSPNECGRIYFAVDHGNSRFVVDHIGLHDYGK